MRRAENFKNVKRVQNIPSTQNAIEGKNEDTKITTKGGVKIVTSLKK